MVATLSYKKWLCVIILSIIIILTTLIVPSPYNYNLKINMKLYYQLHNGIAENLILFLFIDDIAWDWINQKLYWTDRVSETIKVHDPVRNVQKILINTGAGSRPRFVDPSTRYDIVCIQLLKHTNNLKMCM